MFLLLIYYKAFVCKEKKKIYFILSLIVSFLLNVGSLRYLPSVTIPFILTVIIMTVIDNYKDGSLKEVIEKVLSKKMLILFIVVLLSFLGFVYLSSHYLLEQRASGTSIYVSSKTLINNFGAVFDSISNFFGYDNRNHYYTYIMGTQYMVPQNKVFYIYSLRGILNIIKFLACILFIFVTPVILIKNYRKNDQSIKFLSLFNLTSWAIMIYVYVFSNSFFHDYSELKYFIFNIVLNIILGLYCIKKYIIKDNKLFKALFDSFLILYIISNLYTTTLVIVEHNKKIIDKKFELVNTLKKNNLTFGYGVFWDGILTNFLSEYKIEVVSVDFEKRNIFADRWAALSDWYEEDYHKGKTFLIVNNRFKPYVSRYIDAFGQPNETLRCTGYVILVYNNNPFAQRVGEENE